MFYGLSTLTHFKSRRAEGYKIKLVPNLELYNEILYNGNGKCLLLSVKQLMCTTEMENVFCFPLSNCVCINVFGVHCMLFLFHIQYLF
jgi:hypothetical protein